LNGVNQYNNDMREATKKNYKLFSHPRWHEPIDGEVVGHETLSEERQKEVHDDAVAVLKSMGG